MTIKYSGLPYLLHTKRMDVIQEKVGTADWTAGETIVAYGVKVGLRSNKPRFLDKLLAMLPEVWRPSPTPSVERLFSLRVVAPRLRSTGRTWHQLYEDEQVRAYSDNLELVLETFERQLKVYLAEMARRRVFVHAGAVGWQGQAIIIPGRSYSGKTSLVAELVRAGATYYSDDYAVLDKRGWVHPYATPLEVRTPGSHKQQRCSVDEFGGEAGAKPLPVGLVVVTHYEPGEKWRPRQLSQGQAVLDLFANTISARRKPQAAIATLQQVVKEAVVLKSARGEAQVTAKLILDHLNRNTATSVCV